MKESYFTERKKYMAKLENLNKYNFQDKLPTPVLKPLSKNRFYQNRVLRFLKA
jgi:hypothetical protein